MAVVRPTPGPRQAIAARNIRKRREAKGLSRDDLADRTNGKVTAAVVANLELGRSLMTIDQYYDLCEALGASPARMVKAEA